MTHVAHLIKGLGRGGAEGLLPQTVRASKAGIRWSVGYFLPWKDNLVAELESAGAAVHCFSSRSAPGLLASVPRVAGWLRRQGVDLVHAHLPLAGVAARLAGKLAGVPVVYTEHNLQPRYHPLTRRANGLTWRAQAHVVAVSHEVAESINRHFGTRVPLTVVRNGIEVHPPLGRAEVAEVRRRLDLPESAPVIGTVAVLRAQKRLDLWLEAARLAHGLRPDLRFVIVGDGPLRRELEAKAAALGIDRAVRFTGLQADVRPYLAAFDLFLMSSEFEGLPLALLEAMAAGLPVVATSVGGVAEALEDGSEGRLVPFGDPATLARAAVDLLADEAARRACGRRGRQKVEREFGVTRMARQLEAIYRQVLDGDD